MIMMTIAAIVIIIIILSYLSCDGFTTIILYLPQGSIAILCYSSLLSITSNEGEREHFVYVQLLTEQIQLLCQDDDGERLSIRPTGICEAITG